MEVVPAGPSYRPIVWLCVSNVVPLVVITQVLKSGYWPANPMAIMLLVELLKGVISFLLKATSSSSSFSSQHSSYYSSSHLSSHNQGHSSIGSTRSALSAPLSSVPEVDLSTLQGLDTGSSEGPASPHEHPSRHQASKKRLYAQIAGLSILYTVCNFAFFYLVSSIPSTTFALVQTLSSFTSGLVGLFFLGDTITSTQLLVTLLHVAAVAVAQWDACGGGALSSFGSLLGILALTFLQQIAHIWHQSLIRSSGQSVFWISTVLAVFSLPSVLWTWLAFPDSTFLVPTHLQPAPTHSTTSFLALVLTLTSAPLLHAHVMSNPSLPEIASGSAFLIVSPLISMFSVYALDFFVWHSTNITLTVVVALLTTLICAYSFFAFASDTVVRLRLGYRRSAIDLSANDTEDGTALGSFTTITTGLLPDFVVVKFGWRRFLVAIIVILVVLLFVEGGRGSGSYATTVLGGVLGTEHDAVDNARSPSHFAPDGTPVPIVPVSRVRPPSLETLPGKNGAKVEYFGTNDDNYYKWDTREEDEEEAIQGLVEHYIAARGAEDSKKKSVAVCLGGYFYDDFEPHDLDWLQALYSLGTSHDVFIWQGHESVPFATGRMHPRAVSLLRSNGPPLGMHRRYLNKQYDNEFWAYHMHGWNHCVSMIRDHSVQQGITYDYMLVARPTTPLAGHPIPHFNTWDKTSITFPPHVQDMFPENMFWGPYKMVTDFIPYLHASLISYTGDRNPYVYARKLAEMKGFKVKELKTWA